MAKLPSKIRTLFSVYEVGDQIGQGGSGHVFAAVDEDGANVAVKVLDTTGISRRAYKRFENEVRFGANTQNEHVVRVIDYGVSGSEESPIPFLVMLLYEGSLRDLMKAGIAPDEVLPLFGMLLSGLEVAHLQGVTHRDVKPENFLFLHSSSGDLTLAAADFGIARFKEEDLYTAVETRANDRLANFQYASPEQRVRGRDVDNRSDIFSLGLLLNEIFTGEIPSGSDIKTIGDTTVDYEFLDPVVNGMIKQQPDDRYSTISEIRREIRVRSEHTLAEKEIDRLKSIVIENSETGDPILDDPIRLVDGKWNDGIFTLELSQQVNEKWINAFLNMGSHSAVGGAGPERFSFDGDRAIVQDPDRRAQEIIGHFKDWLPKVHQGYKQRLAREAREYEVRQEKELEENIRSEELNTNMRDSLRF